MSRRPSRKPGDQSGVALLSALLIVLVLAALSVSAMDGMKRSRQLDANASSLAQAQWFAIGAEAQVLSIAADLRASGLARAAFAKGERAFAFPLEHGAMEVLARDGSLCINLNSVMAGAGEILQRHEGGAAQLGRLMTELGLSDGQALRLVDAIVNWIDTDNGSQTPNVDDSPYLGRSPPYLTSGQPISEVSELRAIDGFTPEIIALLQPHVCALPMVGPSKVNINALTPEDAPVLVALSGGVLTRKTARDLIASRPVTGWLSVGDFWTQAQKDGLELPSALSDQIDLDPRYLDLTINVVHLGAEATLSEQLVLTPTGYRTAARRWSNES